jgi:D-alanine-D-alanine ligase
MRTIAIVAGGNSSEYPVSVRSAQGVEAALKGKYETYIVNIKGTEWYWEDPKGRLFRIDKNDFTLVLDDQRVRFDAALSPFTGIPVKTAFSRVTLT